jgi:hypothetical protein
MKFEYSKRVRALLRQLARAAHERELRDLLNELEESFARWRRGEVDTWDLVEEVDRFVQGPVRRRLSQRYGTDSIVHMNVAYAIVRGLLAQDEVPAEVLDKLDNAIGFYRQGLADGTISFDEEGTER